MLSRGDKNRMKRGQRSGAVYLEPTVAPTTPGASANGRGWGARARQAPSPSRRPAILSLAFKRASAARRPAVVVVVNFRYPCLHYMRVRVHDLKELYVDSKSSVVLRSFERPGGPCTKLQHSKQYSTYPQNDSESKCLCSPALTLFLGMA